MVEANGTDPFFSACKADVLPLITKPPCFHNDLYFMYLVVAFEASGYILLNKGNRLYTKIWFDLQTVW